MTTLRNPLRLATAGMRKSLIGLIIALLPIGSHSQEIQSGPNLQSMECGSLDSHYGPWDYTNPVHFRDKLPIVENAHFNSNVEFLREGMTGDLPGDDLDYTLRTFPNHHRALYSMARYSLRYPNHRVPPGANYSGYCYFDRAIRFAPNDAAVRLIFGVYLSMQNRHSDAIEQMKAAVDMEPSSAEAHYNLGLLYEKTGAVEEAVQHARIAYELGYPLEGLKNKLRKRGAWDEQ